MDAIGDQIHEYFRDPSADIQIAVYRLQTNEHFGDFIARSNVKLDITDSNLAKFHLLLDQFPHNFLPEPLLIYNVEPHHRGKLSHNMHYLIPFMRIFVKEK